MALKTLNWKESGMIKRRSVLVLSVLAAVCVPALAEEETEYMAVLMEGKKVGYAIHKRVEEAGKVTTTDEASITVTRLGFPITIKMTETSVETTQGRPLRFQTVQDLGAMMMKVAGTVAEDGTVSVVTASMGVEEKSTMPWPRGAVMAEGLRLRTLEEGLEAGTEYTVSVFSPGIMQAVDAKVTIGPEKQVDLLGRKLKLTEMVTVMSLPGAGRVRTTSYVDDELRQLKSSVPLAGMQVEMIACPKEIALGDNEVLDLIDRMFVKSPEPIRNVSDVASMRYALDAIEGADFVIPDTDNQKARRLPTGKIILVVEPAEAEGGVFPYDGDDPALREATEPTRFLQSDRPEIVKLARKAVGDAKNAAEAARRIESFVARYIDNVSLSIGYASAAEVLETREGDCTEFAVLTAALCRAVGIPAQVAVGIAYVDDFSGMQGFGGHAWTHAYVGGDTQGEVGKWIGLDAAFKSSGRGGFDPGHITLATGTGEPGDFFNIAGALGQFTIEKIEVERVR